MSQGGGGAGGAEGTVGVVGPVSNAGERKGSVRPQVELERG